MGSFSMTCSISGLGIDYGTPVVALLLTASPYAHDDSRWAWIIRTPPIRAKYNACGSIEDIHPDDQRIADLWLRGLREDAVEKGLGDNSCHDVAVSRNMTFEEMLDAIQVQRLEVYQDVRSFWGRPKRGANDAEGVDWVPPLMKHVEGLLEAMKPGCVSRNASENTYVVDEPVPGMARVRFGRYPMADWRPALAAAQAALEADGLACTITAGTGRYANEADLLVFLKPREDGSKEYVHGTQWDTRRGASADQDKTLAIGLAIIREDVWTALTQYPHSEYMSDQYPKKFLYEHIMQKVEYGAYAWFGLDTYKLAMRKSWEGIRRALLREPVPEGEADFCDAFTKNMDDMIAKVRAAREKKRAAMTEEERNAEDEANKAQLARWEAEEQRKKDHPFFGDFRITTLHHDAVDGWPGGWLLADSVPGVIGIGEHLSMLLADKVEPWDGLMDHLAELASVRRTLLDVGVVLRPSVSSGPQFPEWGASIRFARTVLDVATRVGADCERSKAAPATLAEAAALVAAEAATSVEKKVKPKTKTKKTAKKPAKKKAPAKKAKDR